MSRDYWLHEAHRLPTRAVPLLAPLASPAKRRRWLEERRAYVCASDVATILRIPGAYRSPFALWWAKTVGLSTDVQTEEQEWGHRLEPAIARKFAELHPELRLVTPPASLWRHRVHEFLACTPDRFAVHRDYVSELLPVELKTDQHMRRWPPDEPPEMYAVQLLAQCAVMQGPDGPYAGWLVALVNKRYREYRLEFGQDQVNELVATAGTFHESVVAGYPPDIDGHPTTTAALEEVFAGFDPDATVFVDAELADRYEQAWVEAGAAKARLRAVGNELRVAMGEFGIGMTPTGRRFVRRSRYKRAGYTVAPTEVDELRHIASKET